MRNNAVWKWQHRRPQVATTKPSAKKANLDNISANLLEKTAYMLSTASWAPCRLGRPPYPQLCAFLSEIPLRSSTFIDVQNPKALLSFPSSSLVSVPMESHNQPLYPMSSLSMSSTQLPLFEHLQAFLSRTFPYQHDRHSIQTRPYPSSVSFDNESED